jgi:hypothetical protein
MPAKIVVVEGAAGGQEFPIEEELTRIGSAPDCPIRVGGVPPHAMTVQFRNDRYWVFNRCLEPIRVGSRKLAPNDSMPWEDDQDARIDSANVFRLTVESDPHPMPQEPIAVLPENVLPKTDSSDVPGPNRPRQAVIVGGGMLLLALFLFSRPSDSVGSSRVAEQFNNIVSAMHERAPEDLRLGKIRALMQEARALEYQGYPADAAHEYRIAQKWASAKRREDDPLYGRRDIAALERAAREFIGRRLERLGG